MDKTFWTYSLLKESQVVFIFVILSFTQVINLQLSIFVPMLKFFWLLFNNKEEISFVLVVLVVELTVFKDKSVDSISNTFFLMFNIDSCNKSDKKSSSVFPFGLKI